MLKYEAKFQIGEVIHHKLFDYIGVVFDVDPVFSSSDEWYEHVAQSRPSKDNPWYHVLVNQKVMTTYVAEQNLESVDEPQQIEHNMADHYFSEFDGKKYISRSGLN